MAPYLSNAAQHNLLVVPSQGNHTLQHFSSVPFSLVLYDQVHKYINRHALIIQELQESGASILYL